MWSSSGDAAKYEESSYHTRVRMMHAYSNDSEVAGAKLKRLSSSLPGFPRTQGTQQQRLLLPVWDLTPALLTRCTVSRVLKFALEIELLIMLLTILLLSLERS